MRASIEQLFLCPEIVLVSRDLPESMVFMNLTNSDLVKFEQFHAVCVDMILQKQSYQSISVHLASSFGLEELRCQEELDKLILFLMETKFFR